MYNMQAYAYYINIIYIHRCIDIDRDASSESLPKKKSEARLTKAETGEDNNSETNSTLNGENVESRDMREKMKKQHMRRPIHRAGVTYRVKDTGNSSLVEHHFLL